MAPTRSFFVVFVSLLFFLFIFAPRWVWVGFCCCPTHGWGCSCILSQPSHLFLTYSLSCHSTGYLKPQVFARLLLMLWCSPSHVGFNWMKNRICKSTNLRSKDLPGRPSWPPVISLTVLVETLPPTAGNPPGKFKELTQAWMNNSDSIVTWKKHWPFPFTCLEVFHPHCLGFVLQYVPVQALTLC